MGAADTARSIADLVEARLAAHLGDGQLLAVRFARVAEVDTADRLVRVFGTELLERWIPYEGAPPGVGEVWRVLEAEDGREWLEDWAPHGQYVFGPEGEELIPYLGHVRLVAGAPGAGSTPVTGTVLGQDGAPMTIARAVLDILVADAAADAEPSASATLAAGATGDVEAGAGTAQLYLRAASDGGFAFLVQGPAGTRYVRVRGGQGSRVWVRQEAEPLAVVVG